MNDNVLMVTIPKGPFVFGESPTTIDLNYDFEIDSFLTTNERFGKFIESGGYSNLAFWSEEGLQWKEKSGATQPDFWEDSRWNSPELPVVGVNWYEAQAFAKWAGKRLPDEKEWEKAARGTDWQTYPWGNEFEENKCNSSESGTEQTTSVSKYSNGLSPYGCYDMMGNVWEWTSSFFEEVESACVLRGGSTFISAIDLGVAGRSASEPQIRMVDVGFRCAR